MKIEKVHVKSEKKILEIRPLYVQKFSHYRSNYDYLHVQPQYMIASTSPLATWLHIYKRELRTNRSHVL